MEPDPQPSISVVIPTLNSASVLEQCLGSIKEQNYPQEKVEIIIADGGSTDKTVEIAEKYGARVYKNELKTGEAGKSVGIKKSTGDLVALIDSDNILPSSDWFERMVEPFRDSEVVGSEPWAFTYRKEDGFIDRYCAMMGMNDPLCYFLGTYDRQNVLSGTWTTMDLNREDRDSWLRLKFGHRVLPTFGANGTIYRRSFLEKLNIGDYFFDVDILPQATRECGEVVFAKVKIGIAHLYCGSSIPKFYRKQNRRISDYLHNKKIGRRSLPQGLGPNVKKSVFVYSLSCLTVLPLLYQTIKGFILQPDPAWFFHPLACWITFWVYAWGFIRQVFINKEHSREGWRQ